VVGKQAGLPLPRKGKVKQASVLYTGRVLSKKKEKQATSVY